MRRIHALTALTGLLMACGDPPTAPASTAPASNALASTAPASSALASTASASSASKASTGTAPAAAINTTPAPAALRAAWRESIKYRGSFKALVQNIEGLEADKIRVARMIAETRMYEVIPVAPVPGKDAQALNNALQFHADRLDLKGVKVDIKTNLPRRAPARRVLNTAGVHYTPEQLVGTHRLTLTFPKRAAAETFVRAMRQLPRVPLLQKIKGRKGKTVVTGIAPYFVALKPAQVYRATPRPKAIISRAGGAGSTAAEKLQSNYAQVDAIQPKIQAAFDLEAELKLTTSRFSAFTAHATALEQMSWRVLTGQKAPDDDAGHRP
jgi:hypothetical protein